MVGKRDTAARDTRSAVSQTVRPALHVVVRAASETVASVCGVILTVNTQLGADDATDNRVSRF